MFKEWLKERNIEITYENIDLFHRETNTPIYQIKMSDNSVYISFQEVNLKLRGDNGFVAIYDVIDVDRRRFEAKVEVNTRYVVKQERF